MQSQRGNTAVFFLILVIISLGLIGVFKANLLPVPSNTMQKLPSIAPTPTPTPKGDTDVHNPDGTMKLIMHMEPQTDGSTIYTFFVADISGANKKLIFTKTVSNKDSFTLPQNAFSPDNKLVFIKENDGTQMTYLVLKVSGEPFTSGQFLDVMALWQDRKINLTVTEATGWAGPTLLIITTKKDDGTKGPSFWFVTDTKAFLQLAR